MSSQVFYRKWRPKGLEEIVGQEPIVQTLRQALRLGRVAHAYLFCGPRGTGKTSTARILAKAVNCLSPQQGEPCNACSYCLAVNQGRALDLVEIDAASHRGIDEMRNLREKVHYTPAEAKYKVYIVDEAHMLTEAAFNALLKTLEEPPPHAIFVLATTEPHKVPATIISRCQRFDFRRISTEAILQRLATICTQEGIVAEEEALKIVARNARGSLRDAENLLEQLAVSYGPDLTTHQVRDLLGLSSSEQAWSMATYALEGRIREGLVLLNTQAQEGQDLRQFHRELVDYLRGLLLLKSGAEEVADLLPERVEEAKALVSRLSLGRITQAVRSFGVVNLRLDTPSPLALEIALMECAQGASSPTAEAEGGAAIQEPAKTSLTKEVPAPAPRPIIPGGPQASYTQRPVPSSPPRKAQDKPEATQAAVQQPLGNPKTSLPASDAQDTPSQRMESQWDPLVKALSHYKGRRFNLGALLRACSWRRVEDNTLTLGFVHRSYVERMEEELANPESRRTLEAALAKLMGAPYKIQVTLSEEGNQRDSSSSQESPLVKAALKMGGRIIQEQNQGDGNE